MLGRTFSWQCLCFESVIFKILEKVVISNPPCRACFCIMISTLHQLLEEVKDQGALAEATCGGCMGKQQLGLRTLPETLGGPEVVLAP